MEEVRQLSYLLPYPDAGSSFVGRFDLGAVLDISLGHPVSFRDDPADCNSLRIAMTDSDEVKQQNDLNQSTTTFGQKAIEFSISNSIFFIQLVARQSLAAEFCATVVSMQKIYLHFLAQWFILSCMQKHSLSRSAYL